MLQKKISAPFSNSLSSRPSTWRISGKVLAQLCLDRFCARCFWLRQHLAKDKAPVPWQTFPGIFNSLDSYSKKLVHGHFDTENLPPPWLTPLGQITGYLPTPTASTFYWDDPTTGVRLTGAPDAVFQLADGTLMIADYKTARLTKGQDELGPLYFGQLNAYRRIAEALGWPPVSRLSLIYTEPKSEEKAYGTSFHESEGFKLHFRAKFKEVEIEPGLTEKLLIKASGLLQRPIPKADSQCRDCRGLKALIALLD